MRPKSIVLLLLAVGCGLVASIGISQVMNRKSDAPPSEKEPILVAMRDIKVNEPLTEKNLKLEDWPAEKIPADAIRDFIGVENQRAGTTILSGEPMRKAKFAVDKRTEEIPKGYRVIAVQADAVSATGNLLQPGDRVDVLFVKHARGGNTHQASKTILQDVRVFAINEQWRAVEGNKSDESIAAKTVSILVTPSQAEIIALASDMGKVRLVLRHPDDEQVADTSGTDENEILASGLKGDRNKELAGDQSGGLLAWLKQQQGPAAAPAPARTTQVTPGVPEERFSMELLEGNDIKNVEFTRRGNAGRWSNAGSVGGNGGKPTGARPPASGFPSIPTVDAGPTTEPSDSL